MGITEKNTSFEENFKKLERLSEELQNDKVSIDELVPRIREALVSIKICKKVLQDTKIQLTEIDAEFKELEKESGAS